MQPVTELVNGLDVLQPFLRQYGFVFDKYENKSGSGGQFSLAYFSKEQKKFVIGYRYSVGELYYQFNNFKVGHSFYLDYLGCADKKQFPDFQSDDKLLAFKHILHDFKFFIDDFFEGSSSKLIEASKLQETFVQEHNKVAQTEWNYRLDKTKIGQARQKFKEKEYKRSLEIYDTVVNREVLTDLDTKAIAYCLTHAL